MYNEGTSLEEMCFIEIRKILEKMPDKGMNIDLNLLEKEYKKIEVSSSVI